MKSPLFLALFSTVLATSCTKEAGAAPATPPAAPAQAPASTPAPTPATNTPAATPAAATPAAATPAAGEMKVPSVADLGAFLTNIKDGATATAAKAPLEALVKQLQTAKDSAAAAAPAGGSTGTLGGLAKIATDGAAKLGISPDVMKQITSLLEKPEVKAVLGSTLEKLQGLMK